jgi:glycosyltransferase involved in cell wall biosynthesis
MPKVTICIPTYNRSNYLIYAVNSVFQQTYSDFELIICDDGSSDNTSEIVGQWNDPRLRYIRHSVNIGRSRNMRSGFEAARGEYFIKFDDDDGLTPDFLAQTVAVLDQDHHVDFVCSDHWIINRKGEKEIEATKQNSAKWGKDKLARGIISNLLEETFINQSLQVGSTLFRRQCLLEVDYMRPEADGCEDFDLLVRLAIAKKTGYFIPELLMEYRFHGGQTSLKQDLHFLSAKAFCLESYHFSEPELESIRCQKLAGIQRVLAMRLLEAGDVVKGRELLNLSSQFLGRSNKATFGLILSYFPLGLRKLLFNLFRQSRPKNYSERVRNQ